jgi:hypothetical protein
MIIDYKPTQMDSGIHSTSVHPQEQQMTSFIHMLDRAPELTSHITKCHRQYDKLIAVSNGYNTQYEQSKSQKVWNKTGVLEED